VGADHAVSSFWAGAAGRLAETRVDRRIAPLGSMHYARKLSARRVRGDGTDSGGLGGSEILPRY
jgi:hypothetical protein